MPDQAMQGGAAWQQTLCKMATCGPTPRRYGEGCIEYRTSQGIVNWWPSARASSAHKLSLGIILGDFLDTIIALLKQTCLLSERLKICRGGPFWLPRGSGASHCGIAHIENRWSKSDHGAEKLKYQPNVGEFQTYWQYICKPKSPTSLLRTHLWWYLTLSF